MGLALDGFPFTCEKYGSDKVALLIELCHRSGIPPLEGFVIIDMYLPLTYDEQEQQSQMIERNLQTMLLIDPKLKEDYEKFKAKLEKEYQEGF